MTQWLQDVLVPVLTALGAGGATWIYSHSRNKAEVEQVKQDTTKIMQDTYQELVDDLKKEINELKVQVSELRTERDQYERDMRVVKDALYEMLDSTCQIDCDKRKRFPSKKVEEILERLK